MASSVSGPTSLLYLSLIACICCFCIINFSNLPIYVLFSCSSCPLSCLPYYILTLVCPFDSLWLEAFRVSLSYHWFHSFLPIPLAYHAFCITDWLQSCWHVHFCGLDCSRRPLVYKLDQHSNFYSFSLFKAC